MIDKLTKITITGGNRELNIRAHQVIDNRVYVAPDTARIIKALRMAPTSITKWYLDGNEIEIITNNDKRYK